MYQKRGKGNGGMKESGKEKPVGLDYYKASLVIHEENHGKWAMVSKVPLETKEDLSIAYTPGVAQPCLEIKGDPEQVYRYTAKQNTVAVVSDGSAVLGLGNIGGKAAIPVMEGKAILFKGFGDIDAVPICLETQDTEEILMILKNIAPTFGGINLEDISAPRCFEIETRLQEMLDIPVFHDDQHGTAIVTAAALINGAKLVGKRLEELKVVINGAGAAGVAVATMLHNLGVQDILVCDRQGILSKNRDLPPGKRDVAQWTNRSGITGTLQEAVRGRDVFIGVSGPKVIGEEEVRSMAKDPIIFAMSNPEPEIAPELAYAGGAKVVGTGRSDYPNQINNVLVFPGLFRGALDGRAKRITREMKLAAAFALASYIPEAELRLDYVLPSPLDRQVAHVIAIAVKKAWEEKGTKDE